MTPKTNSKASSPKKEAPSKDSGKKAAPAKADKKVAKAIEPEDEVTERTEPAIDPDELEEQEDAAAAESGGGGNAAALAAAAGSPGEMSASFKNFRHHPDMENFYRFIYENDLRHEALAIIDEIMVEKQQKKLGKGKAGH
jgi:hypothetical protein